MIQSQWGDKMTNPIRTTKKFVVGWGRSGNRMAFFITHPELPETRITPIPCDPKDLQEQLVKLAHKIDKARGKI